VGHSIDILLNATCGAGTFTPSAKSEALQFFEPSALPADCVPLSREPLFDFIGGAAGSVR